MKSVLVTGASGFVGGYFCRNYSEHYHIQTVNLRTTPIESISFENVDCVLHCAALVHQMQGAPEREYFEVNFELTTRLADKAKQSGVKQFVFLSTVFVYGAEGDTLIRADLISEDAVCMPLGAYGKSKLAAEQYLETLRDEKFDVAIVRPPMVYGEGAKGNLPQLAALMRWCPLLPFKHDLNRRSLVYVGNLAFFLSRVIDQQVNGIFLAQDSEPVSLQFLVTGLAKALNKKIFLFALPSFFLKWLINLRPSTMMKLFGSFAFDSKRSNQQLQYTPPFSTEQGLRNMFNK